MGVFTEVLDPLSDEWVQIKVGNDWCNRYEIGDDLKEAPEDDVYEAWSDNGQTHLVVIKEATVLAVVSVGIEYWQEHAELLRIVYGIKKDLGFLKLCEKYFDGRSWKDHVKQAWNDLLWKLFPKRMEQRLIKNCVNPIKETIHYEGLTRQIFKTKEIKKN